MVVLHDEVLVEEAEGLFRGRGGEADDVSVEIVEHLAPEVVDGAVALIRDDKVEHFNGNGRVVSDGDLILAGKSRHESRLLLGARVEVRFALEHGEEPLNCRDADLGDGVELVGLHVLDVVKLGELASVVGGDEGLELLEGLAAEVVAVDEEEDAAGIGELGKTVGEVAGGEGFAGACGHLDQRPRAAVGQ